MSENFFAQMPFIGSMLLGAALLIVGAASMTAAKSLVVKIVLPLPFVYGGLLALFDALAGVLPRLGVRTAALPANAQPILFAAIMLAWAFAVMQHKVEGKAKWPKAVAVGVGLLGVIVAILALVTLLQDPNLGNFFGALGRGIEGIGDVLMNADKSTRR